MWFDHPLRHRDPIKSSEYKVERLWFSAMECEWKSLYQLLSHHWKIQQSIRLRLKHNTGSPHCKIQTNFSRSFSMQRIFLAWNTKNINTIRWLSSPPPNSWTMWFCYTFKADDSSRIFRYRHHHIKSKIHLACESNHLRFNRKLFHKIHLERSMWFHPLSTPHDHQRK